MPNDVGGTQTRLQAEVYIHSNGYANNNSQRDSAGFNGTASDNNPARCPSPDAVDEYTILANGLDTESGQGRRWIMPSAAWQEPVNLTTWGSGRANVNNPASDCHRRLALILSAGPAQVVQLGLVFTSDTPLGRLRGDRMQRKVVLLSLLCLAGALPAQEIKLIPSPRSVERGAGVLTLQSPVRIALASASEEDRFAAGLLVEELKSVHRLDASIGAEGNIVIGRPGNARIDSEIARRKLDISGLSREESYVLSADSSGVVLAAKTAEGLFYGVQTLRQLVGPGARVPAVRITDWPALRYRALSIDINRGPLLTEEQMKAAIRTMAEYKLNMLFFYMEHVFQYKHSPMAAPPGGEVTPELIRRVGAYARRYHVDLVPHQQFFGHLHNMLKFELYTGMGEIPHGSVLSPASEKTYEWVREACDQLVKAFPSQFFHVGADETWELGEGQSREMAQQSSVGEVYLNYLQRITEILRPYGKRLFFPSDIVLKHPEVIPKLPKELIVFVWIYAPLEDYSKFLEPFVKNGVKFFVCTTLHNWNRPFPAFGNTRVNASYFARDAKIYGAMGMTASHWADDGEALFNMTWYGIAVSAAAAWQPGLVDFADFDRSFDWAFYRNRDETFVNAIRNLYRIHELVRSVNRADANSALYWVDPFSRYGAETVRKLYPVASKMRLLAEQAAVDVAASKGKARLHGSTVPFLELAARRFDYLGMKIQFSKEIADSYRAVLADSSDPVKTRNRMRRISGMDGMTPSLRDYVHEVKAMYRDGWLMENRPYWLDNVLVRYDAEALYWVEKARLFAAAEQELAVTKRLPSPESLKVVLP